MYHALLRRRVRRVFANLADGGWRADLADTAADVHHVFPGDHALGGERRSREALARWFERLDRLFPGHVFAVHDVAARGWPWNARVAVKWTATLRTATGERYSNDGAHWMALRWTKVVAIHAYLDSQRVAQACEAMAARGVEEAAAAPIA